MAANLPDVQYIRQFAKDRLIHTLESVPGRKDIVIDPDLMKPLDRVAGASLLKEHGVDKIYKLEPGQRSLPGCDQRIYLVRPKMVLMKYIADHVNCEKQKGERRVYKVVMVPRRLHVCEMILESEGVFGSVTIDEFPLDLITLDTDVLSLEMPDFFRTFYLDADQTWIHTIAQSLMGIQAIYGNIPNVYGVGRAAKMSFDLMTYMQGQQANEGRKTQKEEKKCEIGTLFLFDRDVDYATVMCSQLTYEGILDETFGIQCGFVELGREVTKGNTVKLLLSNADDIFAEARNRHFSNVFAFISSKAKELQAGYDKRHGLTTVGAMKDFVSNELGGLKQQHKALTYHIGACEVIMNKKTKGDFADYLKTEHSLLEASDMKENINYIEECIHRQFSMVQTLRLLCLLSLSMDGIPSREYKALKTQFLQSHGYEQMLTFFNLKKLGLLVEQESAALGTKPLEMMAAGIGTLTKRGAFQSIVKKLNLIPPPGEINLKSPTDMSYVFSGAYTPLSCKLVDQAVTKGGFSMIDDVTKLLPGATFSRVQSPSQPSKGRSASNMTSPGSGSRVVLVYFIGGVTYAEIAALRFLAIQRGLRILIATTAIINGNTLLETVIERT